MLSEPAQVVRCWHPEPEGELFQLPNGVNIEVKQGAAAYQISSGEVVDTW
jgi:hypothetical protein